MTLLAGFTALLYRYGGQDDIVLGLPVASRSHPETEPLIGLFANTLPVRTKLSGNLSFRDLLARTSETALAAYAHQDMPFEKLVEELQPQRSLSHNPLVQVFFILQNAPLEESQLGGLKLQHIETDTKTAKGDLFLSLVERPEGLRATLEYNTDLFEAATVERMLRHYQILLEAAADDTSLRVSDLPLLGPEERQQILLQWNSTQFDYPRHLCLHQVFEIQAERTPDAVACVHEYRERT
jgi:non-ribosomal peptide synthetase component F